MTWFKWNCCIFFFLYTVFVLLPYLGQAEGDGWLCISLCLGSFVGLGIIHSST